MKLNKFITCLNICCCSLLAVAEEYQWDQSKTTQKEIENAVQKAAKEFNFAIRGIAKKRLTKSTRPYQSLTLTIKEDKIIFERDGADRLEAIINGPEVTWLDYKVSFKRTANGSIIQTFTAEDGCRENIYQIVDGKIYIQVTVKSKKLKEPIIFKLCYVIKKK